MRFAETPISEDFTILNVVDDLISITLELHRSYYTYYWPCRLTPEEFLREGVDNMEPEYKVITYVTDNGEIQNVERHLDSGYPTLAERAREQSLSLIRIRSVSRAWVWQYAPDGRLRGDQTNEPYDAFTKNGLVAYTGCASIADHYHNFREANRYLGRSVAGGHFDTHAIKIFERSLNRWVEANEQ